MYYEVSKSGYVTVKGDKVINNHENINIEMRKIIYLKYETSYESSRSYRTYSADSPITNADIVFTEKTYRNNTLISTRNVTIGLNNKYCTGYSSGSGITATQMSSFLQKVILYASESKVYEGDDHPNKFDITISGTPYRIETK